MILHTFLYKIFTLLWIGHLHFSCESRSIEQGYKGLQPKELNYRIFGGLETLAPLPWLVSIQSRSSVSESNWEHVCGGTLISPKWIITAAHCNVNIKEIGLWRVVTNALWWNNTHVNMTKRGNSWEMTENSHPYSIVDVRIHSEYQKTETGTIHDAALICLAEPTPQSFVFLAPPAYEEEFNLIGNKLKIVGWGALKTTGNPLHPGYRISEILHEATIVIENRTSCFYQHIESNDTRLCLGEATGVVSACYGDSGGPAYMEFDDYGSTRVCQVGVLSFTGITSCFKDINEGRGVIASQISSLVPWIMSQGVQVHLCPYSATESTTI